MQIRIVSSQEQVITIADIKGGESEDPIIVALMHPVMRRVAEGATSQSEVVTLVSPVMRRLIENIIKSPKRSAYRNPAMMTQMIE